MNIMEYVKDITDTCGVADLFCDKEKLTQEYGNDILKYRYAIVIGHRMKEEIIEKIPLSYNNDEIALEYLDEYYNSHKRVAKIADKISQKIEEEKYNSLILDVSGTNSSLDLKKPFSNKISAYMAGIGWIGKNNLLTTKEYGPRLTWATILTDMPLENYLKEKIESPCGSCKLCVNACPGNAIRNLNNSEESYDPVKCGEYIMKRKDEGHPIACGMCLYICPYGNKKTLKIIDNK